MKTAQIIAAESTSSEEVDRLLDQAVEIAPGRELVEASSLVSGTCVTVWEPGQSSHPAQYAGTISGTIEHVRLVNNQYELLAEGTLEQVTALIEAKAHRLVVRVEWRVKVGGQWEATVYRCRDLRPGDLGQGVEIPEAGFVVWSGTHGRELYASKHKNVFGSLEDAVALPDSQE